MPDASPPQNEAASNHTGSTATPTARAGLVGLVLAGGLLSVTGTARAETGAGGITPPSCETYQRERPRGGALEQLSDLFGLSIYRWGAADYARYRAFMLACKRSLPDFRADMTMPDWEALTEKSVDGLQSYTGYVNRLGEPMGRQAGSRPRPGEPDETRAFETLSCDRFTAATINAWGRGGPAGDRPEAPFGLPLARWSYGVWRALENRTVACGEETGSAVEADRDWIAALVGGMEASAAGTIERAQADEATRVSKTTGILARLAETEGVSAADAIAAALATVDTLLADGPRLAQADAARVAVAREPVEARLRAARAAEAAAWERDRPAREARAREGDRELADLQRLNREREAEAAAERERTAAIEAERQAGLHAEAARTAAQAAVQQQRAVDDRTQQRQAQERADLETLARSQREDRARLASDPCNQTEMRRRLMDAANAMQGTRYGRDRLLDLFDGRTLPLEPNATRSCLFTADWLSGRRGLVTITLRKNSFGEELIEVRPY